MKYCRILVLLPLLLIVAGCATTQNSALRVTADYETVFKACIAALNDVKYSASSTDMSGGVIIAEQAVFMGKGSVARLNIVLSQVAGEVKVDVTFSPPPGTMGGGGVVDAYLAALSQRVPGVDAQSK